MTLRWTGFLVLLLTLGSAARGQQAAVFDSGGPTLAAALAGGVLHLATAADLTPAGADAPAAEVGGIVAGPGGRGLYGWRRSEVLRFDPASRTWSTLGRCEAPVAQAIAAPDGSAALIVLTGRPGEPVLADGRVWRLPSAGGAPQRLEAVRDGYRPWKLWPSRVGDQARLAVGTWRATRLAPFEHRCHFVYSLAGEACEAVWLGSRLSRPYRTATHADLAGDGRWRLVAIEETEDGGTSLGVYQPISFGYEGEWRSPPVAGLTDLAAWGAMVVAWGRDGGGQAVAWRLARTADGYRLDALPAAPPTLDRVTCYNGNLVGWWDGAWHRLAVEGGK